MAINVGKLWVMIGGSAAGLLSALMTGQKAMATFRSSASMLSTQLAAMTGGLGATGLGAWAVSLGADLERTAIQFRVLVGDAGRADTLLRDLREYAVRTPFDLPGLSQATSTMLQFGVQVDQIMPILAAFGDLTGGNSERLDRMSLAFAQMSAAGRLMGQDLLQMVNAGFNPLQQIAKTTGEDITDVRKRMEAGAVSAQEVTAAFIAATQAGGTFNGMMEEVAKTTAGRWDILKGRVTELATSIGTALLPAASALVDVLSDVVNWTSNLNGMYVLQVAKIATWVASTTAMIFIGARIVDMIGKIVLAMRAMNIAQAVTLALSGPAGWAKLAAGLAAAGVAAYAVNEIFGRLEDSMLEAREGADGVASSAQKAAEGVGAAGDAMAKAGANGSEAFSQQRKRAEEAAEAAKKLERMAERGKSVTEAMRTPMEIFRDTTSELRDLLDSGAITKETFDRAFAKANADLNEANQNVVKMRDNLQGLGAALDGTMEGFRATAEATRNTIEMQRRQNEAGRQQKGIQQAARVVWEAKPLTDEQKKTNAILTRLDAALNRIDQNTKADAITFDVGEIY